MESDEFISDAPTVASIHDSIFQERFFKKVAEQVHDYLHVSGFHAETLKACVGLLKNGEGEWFLKLDRDPRLFVPQCTQQLSALIESVEKRWSKMRIALALSAPRIREDRILPDIATRINPRPKHPLGNVTRMPPLTDDEKRLALAAFDAEERRLREEFRRIQATRNRGWRDSNGEDRYVIGHLAQFRKQQKAEYWKILEELPILLLVPRGNPNGDDFVAALEKIIDSTHKTLTHLRENGFQRPEVYAPYTVLIDQVLAEEKQYCALAHSWQASLVRRQRISLGIRLLITVVAGFEAHLAESLIVRIGAEMIGVMTNATYIMGSFQNYKIAEAKAFSSALNHEGVASFEALSRDRGRLVLASVFLPAKLLVGRVGAGETREVISRLIRR